MSNIKVVWKPGAYEKITDKLPDEVIYTVARMTLDMSYTTIPMDKGDLRKTSMAAGVRGSDKNYYIGSYTNYAKYVWVMPDSTNWTTPGTHGKWYKRYFDKNGSSILNMALERNRLK